MKRHIEDNFSNQMGRVENILDQCTERYIASPTKNIALLNKLICVYVASKSKHFVGCEYILN